MTGRMNVDAILGARTVNFYDDSWSTAVAKVRADDTGLMVIVGSSVRFTTEEINAGGTRITNLGVPKDTTDAISVGAALEIFAEKSTSATTTLSTSWSGAGPYTQTITVSGVTASNNGVIGIAQSATAAQREAARAAQLSVTAQSENSITVTADGQKPTVEIPVTVILLG